MTHASRARLRAGLLTLGMGLVGACGGGQDGPSAGGGTHNFDSGSGFDASVSQITPALDGSGDMYVIGHFAQYDGATAHAVARLNRDGSLDTAFDAGTGFNDNNAVSSVAPIGDGTGDIYAGGGFSSYRGAPAPGIVRINPDGTDALVPFGTGFNSAVDALALNAGLGDVYAGGSFTQFRQNPRQFVARVNPDGSNDGGFDPGSGFGCCTVIALAVAGDGTGRLYVGGDFYRGLSRPGIVRLNPDGSNDGGFHPDTAFGAIVLDIALAKDGSNDVFAVGSFYPYQGDNRRAIVRIHPDGSDDTSFDPGSAFDGNSVYCISVPNDASGDVYVGGAFTKYKGTPASRIARLTRSGSLDAGFATGSGFNGNVYSIAATTDGTGDVLVGGDFTRYNGHDVGHIARLNPDGSLD